MAEQGNDQLVRDKDLAHEMAKSVNEAMDEGGVPKSKRKEFAEKESTKSLEFQARRALAWERKAKKDALTELPNREGMDLVLTQAIETAKRENLPLAVMLFDLNNFKEVNDTLGHTVGDYVLRAVSQRLSHLIREGDVIGRYGKGDEFLLVALESELEDAILVAQRLVKGVNEMDWSRVEISARRGKDKGLDESVLEKVRQLKTGFVSTSVGVTVLESQEESSVDLFQKADKAVYEAKRTKGVDICVLDKDDVRKI